MGIFHNRSQKVCTCTQEQILPIFVGKAKMNDCFKLACNIELCFMPCPIKHLFQITLPVVDMLFLIQVALKLIVWSIAKKSAYLKMCHLAHAFDLNYLSGSYSKYHMVKKLTWN